MQHLVGEFLFTFFTTFSISHCQVEGEPLIILEVTYTDFSTVRESQVKRHHLYLETLRLLLHLKWTVMLIIHTLVPMETIPSCQFAGHCSNHL